MHNIRLVGQASCTGCAACFDVCPKRCIDMIPDEEGFLFPSVNEAICVDCSRCTSVCPALNHALNKPRRGFIARSLAPGSEISSSGGMAYTLAFEMIKSDGLVIACVLDEDGTARHRPIESLQGLKEMQGSKYIQSDALGAYEMARIALKRGRRVLFIGTPCQVAAARNYVGKMEEGMLTVDLVCHGVPSPLFWKRDLDRQNKAGRLLNRGNISFRAHSSRCSASFELSDESSKLAIPYERDAYYAAFIKNASLRESCYRCPFACLERAGDITIGDCATRDDHFDFYPTLPVSSLLVNTPHGERAVEQLMRDGVIDARPLDVSRECHANKQLSFPSKRPVSRDCIYRDLQTMSYADFEQKYMIKTSFSWHIKRVARALIPLAARSKMKTIVRKVKNHG